MIWHGETYGNMSKIWLGNRLIVYVDEPEQVDVVLNSAACLNKGDSYKYIQEFLGNGLITSQATEWRHHRKLLNPSFSYILTGKYTPIFNKHIRTLVQNLCAFSGGSAFDIHVLLKNCSMDLICGLCNCILQIEIHIHFMDSCAIRNHNGSRHECPVR